MKITKKSLPALLVGAVCAFGFASCPGEESDADKMENAVEEAGEAAEEAGEEAKEALEGAAGD
jgi:hypothetical protein